MPGQVDAHDVSTCEIGSIGLGSCWFRVVVRFLDCLIDDLSYIFQNSKSQQKYPTLFSVYQVDGATPHDDSFFRFELWNMYGFSFAFLNVNAAHVVDLVEVK